MPPYAPVIKINELRESADIIEEVNGLVTYLGFCEPGTLTTAEQKWSIMKITQSGDSYPTLTTFQFANGLYCFNLVWDLRTTYAYSFKKA